MAINKDDCHVPLQQETEHPDLISHDVHKLHAGVSALVHLLSHEQGNKFGKDRVNIPSHRIIVS